MNLSKILTNNGLGNIKISEIIANRESAKLTGLSNWVQKEKTSLGVNGVY